MIVKLKINVAAGLPASLIIRDADGNAVFFRKFIRRANFVILCTRSRFLTVTVRPYNADFYEQNKFIRLPLTKCVCAELFFKFYPSASYEQTFTLSDKNYGFPIANAILYFASAVMI